MSSLPRAAAPLFGLATLLRQAGFMIAPDQLVAFLIAIFGGDLVDEGGRHEITPLAAGRVSYVLVLPAPARPG